jgi:hypothetical protein
MSSTANENMNTNPTGSPPLLSVNRFSNASILSLSSIRTVLPQYSAVNGSEESSSRTRPEFTSHSRESLSYAPPSWNTPSATEPPHYSLLHHQSLMLTRASTATRFEADGDPQAHQYRYSYPIRGKNPWATLHLHTRDATPGNSDSLRIQPRVPRIWSCDPIKGTLELDLDNPQNIEQISITVRCRFEKWLVIDLVPF